MSLGSLRPALITAHRWAGLILAPIFLIVVLSGAVLSFRPVVASLSAPSASTRVDPARVTALVDRLSATAAPTAIAVVDDGRFLDVKASDPTVAGRWNLADGTRAAAATSQPVDVFAIAESVHKQLLVGLGFVVEAAAWVMLVLVLVGPLLAWRRLRNTPIGWHAAIGWFAFPLVLAAPLTAVLMTLHVGDGATPLPRAARPVTVSEALAVAAPDVDLSTLSEARRFRGGTVMLRTGGDRPSTWVVTDTAAVELAGGPSLVKQIHEGTWGGAASGLLNFVVSLALLGLSVTGVWSWIARRRRERPAAVADEAEILIAHASQTGTATRFAEATARALAAGGEAVAVAPLGTLDPARLSRFRLVLILASSTGDGALPDVAHGFVDRLAPGGLSGVRCAVFGLGDRGYAHFCGGAERLRSALRLAGAEEVMAPAFADGDPTDAWRGWLDDLRLRLGLALARPDGAPNDPLRPLTLVERRRLDDPAKGETRETWTVTLESADPLVFRPGDLIRIAPAPGERERTYSIGTSSRVDPRRLVLTVALDARIDETSGETRFGTMSERLTRTLPIGARLDARISAHPSFEPPEDPSRPILMVAAGSGVAPFVGVPDERRALGRPGPAWLVFGNRCEPADFLWRERFETALAEGTLTRLDGAFSPRPGVGVQVQDRLRLEGAEVRRWLTDVGAILYVCGRRAMVDGVLAAVADILVGHAGLTREAARREVEGRLADGRIRIDAFG